MSQQDPPKFDANDPETGSPHPSEPVFLVAGKLRRPHGIHGEIIMDVLTDFPERLRIGATVYLGPEYRPHKFKSMRGQDKGMLVSFEGYASREEVGLLTNQYVYIKNRELPELPEGEYYHHQLVGLRVVDESGEFLGMLEEILETGANDVYLVRSGEGAELLLPAIEPVVLEVDLERGVMVVRPLSWE